MAFDFDAFFVRVLRFFVVFFVANVDAALFFEELVESGEVVVVDVVAAVFELATADGLLEARANIAAIPPFFFLGAPTVHVCLLVAVSLALDDDATLSGDDDEDSFFVKLDDLPKNDDDVDVGFFDFVVVFAEKEDADDDGFPVDDGVKDDDDVEEDDDDIAGGS